ncbi:putative uncharacterized protein DDB_G0282133 isoform X2 [Diachasma alloeum]|uniref:putative uncharacterized protein DDB_G0282133 isoform X2 n=1 Tax=Diachasma alloeum TaxID=454923 RepID=UPI0007382A4D|nr:putative uncharacterized protein DDB_G0282133 isoform X2 [Diachasma alloeum]
MEDAKSEKSVTMEEQVPQDSSSWGEWTIIHDDRDKNIENAVPDVTEVKPKEIDEDNDKEEECHVVEEAREVIEEIDPSTFASSVVPVRPREEHSDAREEISKIVEPVEQTIPRFGLHANFIAACCLAAAIGFGIGCVVGTGKTQLPSPNIQVSPKPSFRRVEDSNTDVSGETSITVESEPFDPPLHAPNIPEESMRHDHLTKMNDQNLRIRKLEQIPTFKNSLQKLKLSLETLCSLIDKNQRINYENICSRNSKIFEVIELKETVEYIVNEFGYTEDASIKKFIEGIDSKIETMMTSFLDRLSKIVEKMRGKLYQRICLIRNTYDKGAKIQEILGQRSISLENCNYSPPKVPNSEKKRRVSKREERGIDSISEETSEVESSEMGESSELPESHKNKRKNQKSEEFRKKKQYVSNKEGSGDNSNEKSDFRKLKSNHRESNEDSDEQKEFKKFKLNYQESNENSNERKDFKKFKSNHRESNEDSDEQKEFKKFKSNYQGSNEDSNEQKDFDSSERMKNQGKNHSKSKKKYNKQSKESSENFSEDSDLTSSDDQKENKNGNRNDFKPLKKYGTPKGEPKENFVEKKHRNNYQSFNENDNRGQNENVCYSKKCSKPHDTDEKNDRKGNGKNGQWQFERAQGRRKYRFDEEDKYGVWYDDRAKGRERARLGF